MVAQNESLTFSSGLSEFRTALSLESIAEASSSTLAERSKSMPKGRAWEKLPKKSGPIPGKCPRKSATNMALKQVLSGREANKFFAAMALRTALVPAPEAFLKAEISSWVTSLATVYFMALVRTRFSSIPSIFFPSIRTQDFSCTAFTVCSLLKASGAGSRDWSTSIGLTDSPRQSEAQRFIRP